MKILRIFYGILVLTGFICAHAAENSSGVKIRIITEKEDTNVILVGRKGPILKYKDSAASSKEHEINLRDIKFAQFKLDFKVDEINKAVRNRDWTLAAGLVVPELIPTFSYLDIPKNNAVDAAFSAGNYLLKSAIKKSECGLSEEAREKGMDQYKRARFVYNAVSKADWYSNSEPAAMKAALCLVYMGENDEAREIINNIREPMHWDASYGLYWLTLAHLEFADDEYTTALEHVVRSIGFETKDMDVFPNALVLSARCYEEVLDWHRARDVYYEVGRLFKGTQWNKFAAQRLRAVLPQARAGEEPDRVEKVFFGSKEDINEKAEEFLKSLDSESE